MKIIKEITTVSGVTDNEFLGFGVDYGDDDNDVLTQVYQILVFLLLRNKEGANRGKKELKAIWSLLDKNKDLFNESRITDSEEAFTDALYSLIESFGQLTGMKIAFIKACRNVISTGGKRD